MTFTVAGACDLKPLDGAEQDYRCVRCGRTVRNARLPLIARCNAPGAATSLPDALACLHRGKVSREIACAGCGGGEMRLPVYACAVHGECSRGDYSRTPAFAGVKPCTGCGERKPAEPDLPGPLRRLAHYAADTAADVAGGRPRRPLLEIADIFHAHCKNCPLYNSQEKACSVCGCPVSADEPEDNRIAWRALHCSADPPRW